MRAVWKNPKSLWKSSITLPASLLLFISTLLSSSAQGQTTVVLSQVQQVGVYPSAGGIDGGEPAGSTMAVNQQGQLIFGNTYGNKVLELNSSTGVITVLGSLGNIGATAVDPQNNYYLANLYGASIIKIPYVNGAYATFNASPTANCTGNDTSACNVPGLTNGSNGYYFGVLAMTFDAAGDLFFGLTNGNTAPNAIYECNAACTTGNGTATMLFKEPTNATAQLILGGMTTDTQGDLFFTDSAQSSGGSTVSNVNELVYTAGTGYAATPRVLYTYTPATAGADQIDAVNVDASGTVYFALDSSGIFALPLNNGTVNTAGVYAVSTQGAKVLATDGMGNFYADATGSSGDVIDKVSVGIITAPTASLGGSSTAPNVSTILNDSACAASPSVTYTAAENQVYTTEFSATTSGACTATALTNSSVFATTVTFTPSATGTRTATLTATDSAGNTGTATVSGTGSPAAAVATPTFSVAGGTYTTVQTVALVDTTPGAAIYYTTDGSAPTANSTLYKGPITVAVSETINAIGVAAGSPNSAVASAVFVVNLPPAATPTFSPAAGTYTSIQSVTLADATSGASIYYTTDGSTPTASSTAYSGAISVSASETINAIAIATGYSNSAVASAAYTINLPPAATPAFSPAGGTYTSTQTVTLTDSTSGATIYYTTDGSTPTASSNQYAAPLTVSSTETIRALAVATGYSNSAIGSATFTINPPAAAPTFTPAPGTYNVAQAVTLADATAGATIYYTTDGSMPTTNSAVYAGAIAVNSSETIQAIAAGNGYSASPVASAAYNIVVPAATPLFSVPGGTYSSMQTVTISDGTAAATIYFTLDGSAPTTSSLVYTGPIKVDSTETITAIAVAPGFTPSVAASAMYTVNLTFALAPSASSLTIQPGQSGTLTVSLTPQSGFTSTVTFSCSGLPADTGCTFSPTTITPSGTAPVSTILTISSTTPFAAFSRTPRGWLPGASFATALCLLGLRRRRRFMALAVLVFAILGLSLVSGCGGNSKPTESAPAATTATVTITGTAGAIISSTTVALTVQ